MIFPYEMDNMPFSDVYKVQDTNLEQFLLSTLDLQLVR